jgi:tetratricopeptide (TPR) repeat protein
MRTTPVFDVAEIEIHDHRIERKPPAPQPPKRLRFAEAPDGAWKLFAWPGKPAPEHADDPGLWAMALDHSGFAEAALEFAEREPGSVAARLPMYHHVRASLFERAGRLEAAERSYREALALDPALVPAATNLGLLLGNTGRADQGIAMLSEVLQREPDADSALANRAVLLARAGDLAGARADLEHAFAVAPRAALARSLAQLAGESSPAGAEWLARARRLEPTP